MRLHAWAFVLALALPSAFAAGRLSMTVEEEARALIGTEYASRALGEGISPGKLSCINEGGGRLHLDGVSYDDWSDGQAKCQGRAVVILKRAIGEANGRTTWRIVDTLLLPPTRLYRSSKRPNALMMVSSFEGICEASKRPDTSFVALVRWGKRDRIDWRTGVERAWTFDVERGRIVPMSTRSIECEWVEP
jgi:hypothetical protein